MYIQIKYTISETNNKSTMCADHYVFLFTHIPKVYLIVAVNHMIATE